MTKRRRTEPQQERPVNSKYARAVKSLVMVTRKRIGSAEGRTRGTSYPYLRRETGGAGRDRTGGLIVANDALSQLSYSPSFQRKVMCNDFNSPSLPDQAMLVITQVQLRAPSPADSPREPFNGPNLSISVPPRESAVAVKFLERRRSVPAADLLHFLPHQRG